MYELTEEGRRIVEDAAARHGVGPDAVILLLRALAAGNGSQAQFNHPELGGMGQWSLGGMVMIGDMFNSALKYRVDSLATELSSLLRSQTVWKPATSAQSQSLSGREGVSLFVPGGGFGASAWPGELGSPGSTGSQNDLHYAYFPDSRRIAIRKGGHITLYDSGEHAVSGFSQQQGGDQSLTFTSQYGLVRLADLPVVGSPASGSAQAPSPEPSPTESRLEPGGPAEEAILTAGLTTSSDEIFAMLERLAALRDKGILTEAEFAQKKSELLSRL